MLLIINLKLKIHIKSVHITYFTVYTILSAQDLQVKAAEQKRLIDFIESCVEKMQPQFQDSVTQELESRYKITKSATRFSDVKVPAPAETLQWHRWFWAVVCAFRRKIADDGRFLPSTL